MAHNYYDINANLGKLESESELSNIYNRIKTIHQKSPVSKQKSSSSFLQRSKSPMSSSPLLDVDNDRFLINDTQGSKIKMSK